MSQSSEFNWNQPENYDDELGVEPSEIEPSYANPPSKEVIKQGADAQVMRDELETQIEAPRTQALLTGGVLLLAALFLMVPALGLQWVGAMVGMFLLPLGVLALTDWQRMGRYAAATFRRPFIHSSRLAAFGRSYTALSLEEATQAVLHQADELGIDLVQTGATTWEGHRRGDNKFDPSQHKIDIRPSVDRPGMTLITASTRTKHRGMQSNNSGNWLLNSALLNAPDDATGIDPRRPQRPQLPRDSYDSQTGDDEIG